jgi:organic hydroperoxide reductase OsmC/OhrA
MAHLYRATVAWRSTGDFTAGTYSRGHDWKLDGLTVPASASPSIVKPPLSREDAVDPEEAFIASLSSCHMLWFLDLARQRGFVVDAYEDQAEGRLARLEPQRWWIDKVTLRPRATFAARKGPDRAGLEALHEEAHRLCYIANSVRTEVAVEPVAGGD